MYVDPVIPMVTRLLCHACWPRHPYRDTATVWCLLTPSSLSKYDYCVMSVDPVIPIEIRLLCHYLDPVTPIETQLRWSSLTHRSMATVTHEYVLMQSHPPRHDCCVMRVRVDPFKPTATWLLSHISPCWPIQTYCHMTVESYESVLTHSNLLPPDCWVTLVRVDPFKPTATWLLSHISPCWPIQTYCHMTVVPCKSVLTHSNLLVRECCVMRVRVDPFKPAGTWLLYDHCVMWIPADPVTRVAAWPLHHATTVWSSHTHHVNVDSVVCQYLIVKNPCNVDSVVCQYPIVNNHCNVESVV